MIGIKTVFFVRLKILAIWYGSGITLCKIPGMKRKQQNDETRRRQTPDAGDHSNTVKNPDEWSTGDEEMTGAQRSYLNTLSQEAGVEPDGSLTKAEASKKIEDLQQKTGRGVDH